MTVYSRIGGTSVPKRQLTSLIHQKEVCQAFSEDCREIGSGRGGGRNQSAGAFDTRDLGGCKTAVRAHSWQLFSRRRVVLTGHPRQMPRRPNAVYARQEARNSSAALATVVSFLDDRFFILICSKSYHHSQSHLASHVSRLSC